MIGFPRTSLVASGTTLSDLKYEIHTGNHGSNIKITNVASDKDCDDSMIVVWREVSLGHNTDAKIWHKNT